VLIGPDRKRSLDWLDDSSGVVAQDMLLAEAVSPQLCFMTTRMMWSTIRERRGDVLVDLASTRDVASLNSVPVV
jgi:hypothetical protein